MAKTVTFNGTTYTIPEQGDSGAWGNLYSLFLQALASASVTNAGPATLFNKTLAAPVADALHITASSTGLGASGKSVFRHNGGLLQASVEGGRWQTVFNTDTKVFNVLDYGAKGDGTTDDTAAIQAAITAAGGYSESTPIVGTGVVFLPAGAYKCTSTLQIKNARPFEIFGQGKGATRLQYAGTPVARWHLNTAYTVGNVVTNRGLRYVCTTSGTSSVDTALHVSGTGITDGTCVWNCTGQDLASDLLRINSCQSVHVHDMELRGVASSSETVRPRALVNAYIDDLDRTYAPTAYHLEQLWFNYGFDSGSPNMCDAGILYQGPNNGGGVNNSEGVIEYSDFAACVAAIYFTGAQCQANRIYSINTALSCSTVVKTDEGSFTIRNSGLGATPETGYIFDLGAPSDRIIIENCVAESTGHWLRTGGGTLGGSIFPINMRGNRFAIDRIASDGVVIEHTFRGPLILEGNYIDGTPTVNTGASATIKVSSSSGYSKVIIRGNGLNYTDGRGPAAAASIVDSVYHSVGVIEEDNIFNSGNGGIIRTHAGSITLKAAPAAWVASTAYVVGNRVKNGSNSYECTVAGTAAGSGGPTGTGSAIVDGGATWKFIGAVTDGSQYKWWYEVPVHSAATYALVPVIATRTGASAASTAITSVVKETTGFTLTISGVPTGTDTVVVDWVFKWM